MRPSEVFSVELDAFAHVCARPAPSEPVRHPRKGPASADPLPETTCALTHGRSRWACACSSHNATVSHRVCFHRGDVFR